MNNCFRFGTAIAVLKGPGFIAVAADSKQIAFSTDDNKTHHVIDKVNVLSPAAVFVSARLMGDLENYDSHKTASEAFAGATSLKDVAEKFISLSESSIEKMIRWVSTSCPQYFASHLIGSAALETVLAGIEGGIPKAYLIYFVVQEQEDGLHTIKTERKYIEGDQDFGIFFLGESKNANRLMDFEPKIFQDNGVWQGLRKLIRAEIEGMPDFVGPPIRIRIIRSDGPAQTKLFEN